MGYDEFVQELTGMLEEKMGDRCRVRVDRVIKNNGVSRESLTIARPGDRISPIIYLEDYYEKHRRGRDMRRICEEIRTLWENSSLPRRVEVDFLRDWNLVKDRIVCRIVGAHRNRERLKNAVCRPVLDMEIIYYYMFDTRDECMAGVMVNREFLDFWHVTAAQVDAAAAENTKRIYPPVLKSLEGILAELMLEDVPAQTGQQVYVLTNSINMNGAYWMCDEDVMDGISDQLGDHFLVLPSSIHECMILPEDSGMTPGEMAVMVSEINRTEVNPEEVLTDSVYRYERGKGLSIAAGSRL